MGPSTVCCDGLPCHADLPAYSHPISCPLPPLPRPAEGRFIWALQTLGTLGVYLITTALFGSLYPLSESARLTVVVGAGLLLLPLLLIPYGSGGLLSHKAVIHHTLSHYPDQNDHGGEEEAEEDEEQGGGAPGAGSADGESSLTQPLLEPGMERQGGEAGEHGPAADVVASPGIQLEPAVPDEDAPPSPAAAAAAASAGGDDDMANPMLGQLQPAAAPPHQTTAAAPAAATAVVRQRVKLPPELSPMQCLRNHDFWLLFVVLCIGMGSGGAAGPACWWEPATRMPRTTFACSGAMQALLNLPLSLSAAALTLLNNLAQLVHALTNGASAADVTPVLVSIFSVCNCAGGERPPADASLACACRGRCAGAFHRRSRVGLTARLPPTPFCLPECAGRMLFGYLPERLLHAHGTPRVLFLPLVSALSAATCLALAFARLPLLYPLAAIMGVAFGGHWSLFPALTSELFGLARFAGRPGQGRVAHASAV